MCWRSEREKEIHLGLLYQRSKHTWDDVSRKPLWATCYKEVFVACSYLLLWIRLWQLWSRRKLASILEINVNNTSFPRYTFYPVQTSLSIHTVCVEADGVDVSHDISVAKFSVTNKWRSYTLRLGGRYSPIPEDSLGKPVTAEPWTLENWNIQAHNVHSTSDLLCLAFCFHELAPPGQGIKWDCSPQHISAHWALDIWIASTVGFMKAWI